MDERGKDQKGSWDPKVVELVECDKCGARDWKIYLKDYMSQDGDGCLHCEDGTFRVCKRLEYVVKRD